MHVSTAIVIIIFPKEGVALGGLKPWCVQIPDQDPLKKNPRWVVTFKVRAHLPVTGRVS